ncbi:MAG TPA: ParB/RepB/Spo0J family partition protein [Terracidiphilus sp.]|nr:ParB/RepB/Spo0J family partition protein [Terracidiphilus sp.]
MTEKHKALGRGLESLLPRRPFTTVTPTLSPNTGEKDGAATGEKGGAPHEHGGAPVGEAVLEIPVDLLDGNPYQTRNQMRDDTLDELCESIVAMGVIEPIIVRPAADGRYTIVAGMRRWNASRMAEKETVPAVVRNMSNQQAMEMTIVENLQREDLGIMDQARAYQRLSSEFGLTQDEVAERIGKDRSTVTNYLRLLKLPEGVQELVDDGNLSFGHAKALMTMPPSASELMIGLARRIVKHGLTVRQAEEAVTNLIQARPQAKKERIVDPNVRQAEETLRRALGVRVMINDHRGHGKITLQYRTLEDFDRIMEAITGKS